MPEKFFLIDAHSYLYQAFYAIRGLTSPDGEPVNAVFGFARMLRKLIRDHGPDYLAVATDLPGKVFRHEIYDDYKATRKPMPESLLRQIPLAYEMLEMHDIPLLTAERYEADDVMGSAARQATSNGMDAILVTTDKDVEQLIDEKTKVLHIHKNKEIMLDADGLKDKYGIEPWQVVELMSLAGDNSDNIPGAKGIGPKTALKLLGRFGSVDNLYRNLQEVASESVRKKLHEGREKVELSRRLVTIKDDLNLEIDFDACRLDPQPPEKLRRFYSALGFRSLSEEFTAGEEGRVEEGNKVTGRQGTLFGGNGAGEPAGKHGDTGSAPASYSLVDSLDGLRDLAERLNSGGAFAVDLETTSLDPHEAEIVGIAFSRRGGEGEYVAFMGPEGEKVCPGREGLGILKDILEDPGVGKIGQNLKYDMMVLFSHGVRLRGIVSDTMIASHLLNPTGRSHSLESLSKRYLDYSPLPIEQLTGTGDERRGMEQVPLPDIVRYACEDADLAYRLHDVLTPRLRESGVDEVFTQVELPLIEVLARMEWCGIMIDSGYMQELSGELALTLQELEKKIYSKAGTEFNINSPRQLSEILFQRLELPPPRGKKRTTGYSTDRKVLEDLSSEHRIADYLLQWRETSKLKNTYTDALMEIVNPRTGRLHTSFNQTGTATGRLSSSEPNLQNIPVRTALGRRIRRGFVPSRQDMSFLSADYSQVELRVLAHFSADPTLQEAFLQDRDIHRFVASQVYGVEERDVSREMRSKAKAVNFGIVYGQTAYGLARSLNVSHEEAREFIDQYFARYRHVRGFIEETVSSACSRGYVKTLAGRKRPIRGLETPGAVREAAERVAVNTVIQGSAADIIKIAMNNIHRKLERVSKRSRMLIQIHDELLFEAPDDELADVLAFVREEMSAAMELSVPLKVDFATGKNWEDAK